MNSHFLKPVYVLLATLVLSCNRKNDTALTIYESLQSNAHIFRQLANSEYDALTNKLDDVRINDLAMRWHPVARQLKLQADTLCDLIENSCTKNSLRKSEISGLYQSFSNFADSIRQLNHKNQPAPGREIGYAADFVKYGITDSHKFENIYFAGNNRDEQKLILGKFLLDIRSFEHFLMFYYNQLCNYHEGCSTLPGGYVPQVSKNSSIFKPGEELIIKAGIAGYSKSLSPSITFNNQKIQPGPAGYSLYSRKVQNIPGKYSIPVTISYMNQITGKEESITTMINYIVANPCSD